MGKEGYYVMASAGGRWELHVTIGKEMAKEHFSYRKQIQVSKTT